MFGNYDYSECNFLGRFSSNLLLLCAMTEYPEYNPLDDLDESELEQLDEAVQFELLTDELTRTKQRLDYKIFQLQRLAKFEESIRTFGFLSYEEQTDKNEILKQYLK